MECPFLKYCSQETRHSGRSLLMQLDYHHGDECLKPGLAYILFSRCRVLKFKDLVDLKVLLVLFKIFNSMPIPNNIQCLFNKSHRLRSSRSQCQYVRNCIRTNTKAHCLSTYGVKCWNSLPVNIVKIPTVHAFIQKLKINMTKSYNWNYDHIQVTFVKRTKNIVLY